MIARRRVLTFLGLGPIAAKVAADDAVGKLAGLNFTSGLGGAAHEPPSAYDDPVESTKRLPWSTRTSRAGDFLRLGVPGWLEREIRKDVRYVEGLDADLASKRSWSMAVKIAEQRERNYQRRLSSMMSQAAHHRNHTMLSKVLGFDWPW